MGVTKSGRLDVGVVGSGKVGAVLGAALREAGHKVVGVSAVSDVSVERAEVLLPGVPILSVSEVVSRSELVLLTVPDDVLGDLVEGLCATGSFVAGQLVAHTAGRFGLDVLAPAVRQGTIGLALHPAMSFTGTSLDLRRLVGCSFAVTALPTVLPIAQALVLELGGEPVFVAQEDRVLYHCALSHVANNLATLVGQSCEVLSAVGVVDVQRFLAPLLQAALDNALFIGDKALSGPVVRADVGTIFAHVEALAKFGSVDILQSYLVLVRASVQRALHRNVFDVDVATKFLDILDNFGGEKK